MQEVAYGSVRKSSAPYVNKRILNHLPAAHVDEGIKVQGTFWSDYAASLNERFQAWLLR